jgi:beta-lactamase superfamily II metal-dependent hydrolase
LIERIFHPIGQGAFYSERHENFNIVYDCGNWKNTKLADKVVKQAFFEGETIDILFISHFDYDHVNKIKTLKEHTHIKKVIMPLLHDEEKKILINLYRALNFNILTLIKNPQEFFGKKTQIITVETAENGENHIGDNIDPIDLDNLTDTNIQSGSILRKNFKSYEWVFIPFNYEYKARNYELENLLSKNGFDVEQLKTNPKHTINEVILNRKKIKDIYTKVSGNINQNSMLLYSGVNCINKDCEKRVFFHRPFFFYEYYPYIHRYCYFEDIWYKNRHRVSCIYTGDTDLNVVKIKSIFGKFWESVGTIQIPHHGDLKSFDKSVLDDRYYWCPISVGETNSYGHPSSKVIANILSQDCCPILVTENLSSGFIENIRC